MLDAAPPLLQRIEGIAEVAFGADGRLSRLFQKGSAKAMLPRTHGATPEVVFLNTAGGLTGGDRLHFGLEVGAGAYVTATTQTAERAYASTSGAAEMDVALAVGPGARLDWLPQETILFDRAALHRTTSVDLAEDATCLLAEMITLGRAAMGETVTALDLLDRRLITQNGAPVFSDPLRLTGLDCLRRDPAGLAGSRALATIVLVGPGAEDRRDGLRRAVPGLSVSGWDGKLVARAMSPEPRTLRRLVGSALEHLRGAALPRVWQI